LSADRLDDLRPLWLELLAHHGAVAPQLPPTLPEDESWDRRRTEYAGWLRAPGSFVLVADQGGVLLGYLLVEVQPGDDTWQMGERVAEVQTLVVTRTSRSTRVGTALMDAAEKELARRGVTGMRVGVVSTNEDAVRFYRRRGFDPYLLELYKRI
jgi:ribosomal protein S18 acetylase RimI-like enzyme